MIGVLFVTCLFLGGSGKACSILFIDIIDIYIVETLTFTKTWRIH